MPAACALVGTMNEGVEKALSVIVCVLMKLTDVGKEVVLNRSMLLEWQCKMLLFGRGQGEGRGRGRDSGRGRERQRGRSTESDQDESDTGTRAESDGGDDTSTRNGEVVPDRQTLYQLYTNTLVAFSPSR
ncbi:hypothetical protein PPTG_24527 [Phytophthora nicotianae INRA-310]|uniref:Uncharacterized protein n=1 Tax=Phytophthora nicotianae (strain INRA-310) TaxID=761204 RepID=W2PE45_PHYN3|nr:hypothetical protein PPTG_24527 [Phytophthora nicotianae INRA-310]ETM98915.1 hypothetical protein PPTG_24527 [Phytophthora nicotianae INRA-310]